MDYDEDEDMEDADEEEEFDRQDEGNIKEAHQAEKGNDEILDQKEKDVKEEAKTASSESSEGIVEQGADKNKEVNPKQTTTEGTFTYYMYKYFNVIT